MKRKLFAFLLFLAVLSGAQGQKYACVDTDYIMGNVPEYNQVLNRLNKYVEEWRNEILAKQQAVDELREQYQQEAYLLPENLKQRRQDEITTKETELRSLQQQRFSAGGDLDQKRAELLKPIQDRVYNAIERIAREKSYAFVFDKSASNTILYVGEKYDISNQVLEMMGVKPGSSSGADPTGQSSGSKSANNKGGASSQKDRSAMREPK